MSLCYKLLTAFVKVGLQVEAFDDINLWSWFNNTPGAWVLPVDTVVAKDIEDPGAYSSHSPVA
jgi:hypothetical protein